MKYKLINNLEVIYKRTTSMLTSICISIDAGACKEEELLGLAHATEHMIYKGTNKRSEEEINKALSQTFGFQNAMTNYPYVIYYGTMLKEDFEKGVEIFSDIILRPKFSPKGFKEEMDVIKEELKEWDEDLEQYCEDKLFFNSFNDRRIKYPIIGTEESLKNITLKDLKDFYQSNYLPSKTSIAVVSSLDFNEVTELIEKYFQDWKRKNNDTDKEIIYEKPNVTTYKDLKEGTNTCKVEIIFPIDELSNKEIKALRIFNEYFGEGVDSLLYDRLRTKNGLVYDVLTKIAFEKYIKLYKINFSTSKENLEKSLDLIDECIKDIDRFKEEITKEDLAIFIKTMKLKRLFREEQNIILAKELSTYNTMFRDENIYLEEFNEIDNIDKSFIYEVVKKVFNSKTIEIVCS
ncbi:M16 family metallopeptidase [Clostridium sp. MB05]|uniref:M16 family metallopeptidase n=1 Tax=Clostridium sp. MB05 TaxID=3376682 RepID=UPI003981C1D2